MYVFTLPALELLRGMLLGLVVLAAVGVVGAVFRRRPGRADAVRRAHRESRARRHLAWLAAVLFLVLALGAWLSRLQEIVSPSGIIQGASYADVHARMPAALALMIAALVAAGSRRRPRSPAVDAARDRGAAVYVAGAARRRRLRQPAAALRGDAERAGPRNAVHGIQHRRDARGVRARSRRGARAARRSDADARRTSRTTARRSTTCGCGITSRCSRRSGRSRRSAPTTTSSRSTTIAIRSTARTGR